MVTADLSKTRRIELILRQMETLPTLPAVAARLLELTADNESRSDEVIELVRSDPALTARVLSQCRTADKGLRGDNLTIERAVLMLGYKSVRNTVLSAKVYELFEHRDPAGDDDALRRGVDGESEPPAPPAFDRPGFWAHCLGVAIAAERIAAAHRDPELPADEAFVCGLLHDIGKLALEWVLPKAYARVAEMADLHQNNIAEHERHLIGVDHHTAGKRLAEQWKLPHRLQDTIWLHGSPYDTLPRLPHRRMIGLITLADLLVRQRHLGYSGNFALGSGTDADELATHLGLDPAKVHESLGDLFEELERRAETLGLNDQVSMDLYMKSIQRANEALGKANAALERKGRSAAAQQKMLGCITDFHTHSTPGRSVQDVLDAVVTSARDLFGPGFYALIHPTRNRDAQTSNEPVDAASLDDELADPHTASAKPGPATPADAPASAPAPAVAGPEAEAPPSRESDRAWLICQYDEQGQPRRSQYVDTPPHAPDLGALDPEESLNLTLMGVLPWIADYLLEAEDLRNVSLMPLPSGWGTSAVLLHDRENLPGWKHLCPVAGMWGTAIAAANQHDGARRLGEQLAAANTAVAEAQQELTKAQTMARLGEMAAGAAHEMNNPLAIISGRSQLLTMALDGGSKEHQAAQTIFRETHRLSDLITALRMFADPPEAHRVPTDIAELLRSVIAKVSEPAKKRREDLSFGLQLPNELPDVNIDPKQIDRAVTELLMNAVQADPRRGVILKVVLDVTELPADEPVGDATASGTLLIQVTDDGEGMDEYALQHATDPFFSAKSAGRQVGMGLSRVAQLVAAHGGKIDLRSTRGRGTTATLFIPLH